VAPSGGSGGTVILTRSAASSDYAKAGLRSQLAAKQPHRLEIGVHIVGAAADEAGDEHAAERRHVHLRRERRLDGHLEEIGAAAHEGREREANDRCGVSRGH
jgi:hypothetical protein